MKIGEVAKRACVSVDTVRFYERRSILPPPRRRSSGYRIYGEGAVERIRLVKYIQALGVELDEILAMLAMLDAGTATCGNQRPRFEAMLGRIDREMAALRATRSKIVRLFADCQAGKCSIGRGGIANKSGDAQAGPTRSAAGRVTARSIRRASAPPSTTPMIFASSCPGWALGHSGKRRAPAVLTYSRSARFGARG